ncbi:MAG: c-type cytochrome [Mesorhizobium sp.]|nr:MAG: c-type cytochrome [Mesorhizobium sp.]
MRTFATPIRDVGLAPMSVIAADDWRSKTCHSRSVFSDRTSSMIAAGQHTVGRHSGNPAIRMCSIQRSRLPGAVHIFSHSLRSLLMDSIKKGCLDCVTALVEAGADVNALTADPVPRTPIHLARFLEHSESDYLMAHGVVLPKPAPIAGKLAVADVEKGQIFFGKNCDGCHNNEAGKGNKYGPNLWEVVIGRDKASMPKFEYSKTLRDWGGVWTYEDLNTFLYGPVLTIPGVRMETPGVSDETERVNLIAYLRTLSDKPIPLP